MVAAYQSTILSEHSQTPTEEKWKQIQTSILSSLDMHGNILEKLPFLLYLICYSISYILFYLVLSLSLSRLDIHT